MQVVEAEMSLPKSTRDSGSALLVLVFLLAAAGVFAVVGMSVVKGLREQQHRSSTIAYLGEARRSLYIFAILNGRLPYADADGDGWEDNQTRGGLPFRDLNLAPVDGWGRHLGYEVNPGLVIDKVASCNTFKAGLVGQPMVWDASVLFDSFGNPKDPVPANPFPVAAVLLSGGVGDADGSGTGDRAVYDAIAGKGDNVSGSPYLKEVTGPFPTPSFDDLVVYVGGRDGWTTGSNTLLDWLVSKDVSWAGCL